MWDLSSQQDRKKKMLNLVQAIKSVLSTTYGMVSNLCYGAARKVKKKQHKNEIHTKKFQKWERSGDILYVDWFVFALKSRSLPKRLENIVFFTRTPVWLSCIEKSTNRCAQFTNILLFWAVILSLTYMCVSRWRVCVLLRFNIICLSFMCGRSCLRSRNYVRSLPLPLLLVFFTLSHLFLFRAYVSSIWKTCTYYDICFRFFGEQEGQLRIVVRTVQTCKLVALRVWEI